MTEPTATFTLPDMSCTHCVGTIRAALERELPGVPVTIDVAARQVSLAADPARAAAILTAAGYPPA